MPSKTWTSDTDFGLWTWTHADLATTPGSVLIETGETMAEGVSPSYECASYVRHVRAVLAGNAPEGTTILVAYRVGATAVACEAATWSDWFNGLYGDTTTHIDLLTDMLNNSVDPEGLAFIQYKVRLYSE